MLALKSLMLLDSGLLMKVSAAFTIRGEPLTATINMDDFTQLQAGLRLCCCKRLQPRA